MELMPVAAALVAVIGAGLTVLARKRIAFLAGVLSALVLLPLCRPALPDAMAWTLSAGAYLVGTLLGGYLLWVALRPIGPRLPRSSALATLAWLAMAGVAVTVGVAAWPLAVAALDASRGTGARLADLLEPGRWSLGAGLALLVVGLGPLLTAAQPARLAAGAAFCSAAAWLIVTGLGAAAADVTLAAIGLVLPAAAAAVAVHSLRPTTDG
ncbi:MAG: hypothetical protein M3472_07205 [Chloroflexota bacterium]|nr:hypothetical protein [Chloroflexota bacterium]